MSSLDDELKNVDVQKDNIDCSDLLSDEELESNIKSIFEDSSESEGSSIVDNRSTLNGGPTIEELKSFTDYMQGKCERPVFVEKYTANDSERLKEACSVMAVYEMSLVPVMLSYNAMVMNELYNRERLSALDTKDLISLSNGLIKSINGIQQNANQTLASTGYSDKSITHLIADKLTSISNEKYARLKELLNLSDSDYDRIKEFLNNKDIV